MTITSVRIYPMAAPDHPRFRAYATITIDDAFAVHDLRILDMPHGLMVAMPSKRSTLPCPDCHAKTDVADRFCGRCGAPLAESEYDGPLHRDVAHPVDHATRDQVESAVLAAYRAKVGEGVPCG